MFRRFRFGPNQGLMQLVWGIVLLVISAVLVTVGVRMLGA